MRVRIARSMLLAALLLACLCSWALGGDVPPATPTDYSKPEHWLSVPVVLDKPVDVFYVYPTAWMKADKAEPDVCGIDNLSMLQGAKAALGRQASAFAPVGNVFAPYYRQVDLFAPDRKTIVNGTPTADIVAAFDYYITHSNAGRPFILAGHSQGANVLSNLLAGYMKEHPDVQARMVAAYIIGYSVTGQYLAANPHLKFAQGAADTGVIISYNTESPDVRPGSNMVVEPGGVAINPISWSRGEEPAPASASLGSVMPSGGFFVPVAHYADARVDVKKGVVVCSTADADKLWMKGSPLVKGAYHSFDIPFYYYNLRQNAADRAAAYLGAH